MMVTERFGCKKAIKKVFLVVWRRYICRSTSLRKHLAYDMRHGLEIFCLFKLTDLLRTAE